MTNQTAAQIQIMNPDTYSNNGYSLGEGHISVGPFPNALQPAQFHANSVPQPAPTPPPASTAPKRKQEDEDHTPTSRKRRVKVFDVETSEVVSGEPRQVGARHWTDAEKGKLFGWLLGRDESWDGFSTQMNTVFRDGAAQIFDNKKTFTAIKSCYHRNVETFKQIYAFEKYLIQVTIPPLPGSTSNGYVALPPSFDSPADRLAFLDQQLEAARALPIETGVGNLSGKVVVHWCRKGWYILFKRRFREDIVSRQIVPLFGKDPSPSLLGKGLSAPAAALFPQPDPPGEEEAESDGEAEAEEHGTPNGDDQQEPNYNQQPNAQASASVANASQKPLPSIKARPRKKTPAAIASNTARFRVAQADAPSPSTSQVQPSPQPQQQPQQQTVVPVYNGAPMANYPGYPPHSYPTAHMYPQPSPHYDYSQAYSPAAYAVHNPQIQHLTQVSQNLVSVVSALVDQLRAQAEDGKALLELMRKREERERANEVNGVIGSADVVADKKERAAVANQVLANPHADEDVRQAARDFLKRLFA